MLNEEKPLVWGGSSKKDLCALPGDVRQFFGHALNFAQHGLRHRATKVLGVFGGATVLEVLENDQDGTYRAVYTVEFHEAVFVLHCFQKKSNSGIAKPPRDMELVRSRLKRVEISIKESRDGKARH